MMTYEVGVDAKTVLVTGLADAAISEFFRRVLKGDDKVWLSSVEMNVTLLYYEQGQLTVVEDHGPMYFNIKGK